MKEFNYFTPDLLKMAFTKNGSKTNDKEKDVRIPQEDEVVELVNKDRSGYLNEKTSTRPKII